MKQYMENPLNTAITFAGVRAISSCKSPHINFTMNWNVRSYEMTVRKNVTYSLAYSTYITKLSIVYNNLCTVFYLPLITTTYAKALFSVSVSMQLFFFFFESCKEHLKNRFTQLPFSVVCHTSFLCNWNNQQSRMYVNFEKYEWVRKLTSYSFSCTTLRIWMNFKFVKSDVNTTVSTLL